MSKASRAAFPSLVHLLCRVALRLFHRAHIVCGEQAFSLMLKWWSIHSWHFLMVFHTPLSEWTSMYLMFLFWSPRSIRPYACLFTERLSPRFHSAHRGCHPHHWWQQRLLCWKIGLVFIIFCSSEAIFQSSILLYHNHFIRPNVPLQVLSIFPLQS